MLDALSELHILLKSTLTVSNAMIGLLSAMITTIGLAIVNKLMSRPSEHWKQASELREELRKDRDELREDFTHAQDQLDKLHIERKENDAALLNLRLQILNLTIELKTMGIELAKCHEKHAIVEAQMLKLQAGGLPNG